MHLDDLMALHAGVVTYGTAARACGPAALARALARGDVIRVRRGVYVDPHVGESHRWALAAGGVLSHRSAALAWGWPIARRTTQAEVIVSRSTKRKPKNVIARYRHLDPADIAQRVTTPIRTVVDCAKDLPFDEALAIADSALRSGLVDGCDLRAALSAVRSNGRRQALRVRDQASALAANPFESVLRAIALDVPGLHLEPQVWLDGLGIRPDLADLSLGLVVEADSFEYHATPAALAHDIERHNRLRLSGFMVLRFGYAHVLHRPDYVHAQLHAALAVLEGERTVGKSGRRSGGSVVE